MWGCKSDLQPRLVRSYDLMQNMGECLKAECDFNSGSFQTDVREIRDLASQFSGMEKLEKSPEESILDMDSRFKECFKELEGWKGVLDDMLFLGNAELCIREPDQIQI